MGAGRPRNPEVDARLVTEARGLLAEGGIEALSISEVARRAGVGRPTVYRRYPDTESLAMAVLHSDLEAQFAALRQLPLDGLAPEDLLATIARHFFDYYARDLEMSRATLQLSLFARGTWSERFSAQALDFLGWIALTLEPCRQRGELGPDVDTGVLAQAFFGFYLPIVIAGASGAIPHVELQEAMLRMVLRQHLEGCRP